MDILRFSYYTIRYPKGTGPHCPVAGPPITDGPVLDGKIKSALSIIEIELRNLYPHEVSVGLIQLDDWIYGDCHTIPMYGQEEDYRVFDLHTKERVSLATYYRLGPGETLSRRLEIIQCSYGPRELSRSRLCLQDHNYYVLQAKTTKGSIVETIFVPEPTETWDARVWYHTESNGTRDEKYIESARSADDLREFCYVPLWSGNELLTFAKTKRNISREPKP